MRLREARPCASDGDRQLFTIASVACRLPTGSADLRSSTEGIESEEVRHEGAKDGRCSAVVTALTAAAVPASAHEDPPHPPPVEVSVEDPTVQAFASSLAVPSY